MALPPLPKPKS